MDQSFVFDNCENSLRRYGGSDRKASIRIGNSFFMIKYNDRISTSDRNDLNSSYRISAYSEYIACHILNSIGIKAQETFLGKKDGKIVVACKDFRTNGFQLNEFEKYATANNIELERYPDINKVMSIFSNDGTIPFEKAREQFWDIFVGDAILGNFDRHSGNWGYLYNDEQRIIELAPVYDCGACLYPMMSDEGMPSVLSSQEKINERIFHYPKSAFSLEGKKIDYYNFLNSTEDTACLKSIIKVSSNVDKEKIFEIIDNTPFISDVRKSFYKTMLKERIEKIIEPARERAERKIKEKEKEREIFPGKEW